MIIERMVGTKVLAKQLTAPTGTATRLVATTLPSRFGYNLKAPTGNAGTVYIGDADVNTSTGYPLAAGESVKLDIEDLMNVYFIGSQASQKLNYCGVG